MSVLAFAGAAHAESPDPVSAQLLCDLAGDCDAGEAAAPAASPAPATPPSGARSSSVRGFSFNRAKTDGAAAQPAPARVASTAAQPALTRPAVVGSADLKLSFMPGSSVLTDDAKARLGKYAVALQNPRIAARRLRIEGHTDATGSARSNQLLSQRRAQAVADYLATQGIPGNRFEVVGYGSSKPLNGIPAESAANRRVLAVLL